MPKDKSPSARTPAPSCIGPEPERYSAAWYDWVESRDSNEALDNAYQKRAKPETK
jgi:hypothetical protein